MLNCPRCQSPNIVSNKLDEIYLARTVQFARAAQNFENSRLSALGGIAALAVKAVDVLRKEYRCSDCEYRFDA